MTQPTQPTNGSNANGSTDAPDAMNLPAGSNAGGQAVMSDVLSGQPNVPAPVDPMNMGQGAPNPVSDPSVAAVANNPNPAQPVQGQPRLWQRVLMGALVGLAGSSGAKTFGAGLAGGAASSIAYQHQQHDEQLQDQESHRANNEANARLAMMHVQQMEMARQYNLAPKSMQDVIDQASMKQGAEYKQAGLTPVFTGDYNAALAQQHQLMGANPNSALSTVITKNTDGNWDIFQIADPNKLNTAPVDVIIGYRPGGEKKDDVSNPEPVTVKAPANTMKVVDIAAAGTAAMKNYWDQYGQKVLSVKAEADKQNLPLGQSEVNKNNADAELARANAAKAGNNPVYAIDENNNTILTTGKDAQERGLKGIRSVKQTDIRNDQHDIKVLNDIQAKSNNVTQAAQQLDEKGWSEVLPVAKYLADHKNTTAATFINSEVIKSLSPAAKNYVINILSLRESAMGLQKVLTGTARTNETQLNALLATLPGVEPNAQIVGDKVKAFNQNISMLRQGLPSGTGIENVSETQSGQGSGQTQKQTQQNQSQQQNQSEKNSAFNWNDHPVVK